MQYRIYLIDEADRIKAAETFIAFDDAEALEMDADLLRATHDVFTAHEVWCGARRLSDVSDTQAAKKSLIALMEERQIRMAALEERLLSSFHCVRRSQALLDATTDLLEGRSQPVCRPACGTRLPVAQSMRAFRLAVRQGASC